MPLQLPKIDDRRYQDLLDEALSRISVHNPEWTNYNHSDPGVTLIEIFAFMTESLLYRANLIPERNRLKFLQLLGIQLNPATSAKGIVAFTNERGLQETITLNSGVEVSAGQIPFRTSRGLDILPIEAQAYYKRPTKNAETEVEDYYKQLYASFQGAPLEDNVDLQIYQTTAIDGTNEQGVSLADDTMDNSIWIALLARENESVEAARKVIAGKILSLGIVPSIEESTVVLNAGGQQANTENASWLLYKIPKQPNVDWTLPTEINQRIPEYRPLDANATTDILKNPGVVEITLPTEKELNFWQNLEPLEMGADDFPPTLEDTKSDERLITWLRISASDTAVKFKVLWVGINAAEISQRTKVLNEILPDGNGEPDQMAKLSQIPVIPKSVKMLVTVGERTDEWFEIDDLLSAGAEIPAPDLRLPPGAKKTNLQNPKVFRVNTESGEIRFGDGTHGERPPLGAKISVSYDFGAGILGNVGIGAIDSSPTLPAGLKVTNPVRTWGGADSETVVDGEKQITRYLQHRERLVTISDFETIVLRTPGVLIGRVEIVPTFNPAFSPNEPGDAPGAVTIMVIPRYDSKQPDAPVPDKIFLDTICRYVDERRLITTEIFIRGPVYKGIWISVGINVVAEKSAAEVREAVKKELLDFLAPINFSAESLVGINDGFQLGEQSFETPNGWRLRKPVTAKELLAVASRVSGVMFVNNVLLAEGNNNSDEQVSMNGLELPRILGISISVGDPLPLSQLRGTSTQSGTSGSGQNGKPRRIVPIPIIPEKC
ncbi:MAG TPA: baseplate J/gp47 family protein [Pyrinomonadaceae bacterium]|nr:baseplate J/gp47 family protein [Pyrinomonadaceae bacterium]